MTDRERLLEILNIPIYPHENVDPLEAVADYLLDNGVTFAKDTNVPSKEKITEQAEDILNKWEFFYGQRAGRELWAEKPEEIQNADIETFCRDLTVIRSAVTDSNVGSKWIPVTERLPEEDGKFLAHRIICGRVSIMSVVGFARNGKKVHEFDLRKHKNVWYDYDSEAGYYPLTTVTHWMPLPEPPKEDA